MTKTQMSGNVKRIMVTKPVSFYGDVFRHGNRNRRTPDDTGIVALTVGRYSFCDLFSISIFAFRM